MIKYKPEHETTKDKFIHSSFRHSFQHLISSLRLTQLSANNKRLQKRILIFFLPTIFILFLIPNCSTINPILYNVMSHRYRVAFKQTLCGSKKPSYYSANGFVRDQSSFRETTVHSSYDTVSVRITFPLFFSLAILYIVAEVCCRCLFYFVYLL